MEPKGMLTYWKCDAGLILAYDEEGNIFYVSTENWFEWCYYPLEALHEKDAVEKYMLPVAVKKWSELKWEDGEDNIRNYPEETVARIFVGIFDEYFTIIHLKYPIVVPDYADDENGINHQITTLITDDEQLQRWAERNYEHHIIQTLYTRTHYSQL